MALTRDPAHNGTTPAIKSDEQSATSSSGEPSANRSARWADAGSTVALYCTYLVCVCGQETPQNDYVVLQQETPGLNHRHGHMKAWKKL